MIPLTKPALTYEEVSADLAAIIRSGRLTGGEYLERFESRIADRVGTAHALATTSCTTALHLVLAAFGIGRDDEVLVSDFTFPAGGNVVAQCGAAPVLVDCVPGRFVLDLKDAEAKISSRTRALIVVDPFGQPADLLRAADLARRYSLLLIEDAACALGAVVDGRACGSWPAAGCFSFHPRKVITTGEGGMITTSDSGLADQLRALRNHGGVAAAVGVQFSHHGFNYRMSEIQAAMGLAQMERLDDLLRGRALAAASYVERLEGTPGVSIPAAEAGTSPVYQSFVVMLDDDIDRDKVVLAMRRLGVEATLGTYAMHAHPAFAGLGYRPGDLPYSWRAQQQTLSLPLWPFMPEGTVDEVVNGLKPVLESQRATAS